MSALDAVFDAITAFRNTDGEDLRRLDRYIDADAINCLPADPSANDDQVCVLGHA